MNAKEKKNSIEKKTYLLTKERNYTKINYNNKQQNKGKEY